MTIDLGAEYRACSIFVVANVNNVKQSINNIVDAGKPNPSDSVLNRASIATYADKLVVGTQLTNDMMVANKKIVVPQEYNARWDGKKPVVFYSVFANVASKAGYYVPVTIVFVFWMIPC